MSILDNTTALQELLAQANALPEAESGDDKFLARITGTLTEITESDLADVTTLAAYAFAYCQKLVSAVLPSNIVSIPNYAFYYCDALADLQILGNVTELGEHAFQMCKALSSVSFPNVTEIPIYCFMQCAGLINVEIPLAESVGGTAFCYCTNLSSVSFPLVTTIDGQAFANCTNLTSVNLPAVTSLGFNAFNSCTSLAVLDFPALNTISGSGVFGKCTALTALILRADAVVTLANSNSLSSTPIADGTGYTYVPSAWVDSYKAATNWTTYADQIRALEDYTVDGTTTGALDESKI